MRSQQSDFTYKLGLLMSPVVDVIKRPHEFSSVERRRIRARFQHDQQHFREQLCNFCMSQSGASYQREWEEVASIFSTLVSTVDGIVDLPSHVPALLDELRAKLLRAIAAVPVQEDSQMYLAATPFTSYLKLKQLCESGAVGLCGSLSGCNRLSSPTGWNSASCACRLNHA